MLFLQSQGLMCQLPSKSFTAKSTGNSLKSLLFLNCYKLYIYNRSSCRCILLLTEPTSFTTFDKYNQEDCKSPQFSYAPAATVKLDLYGYPHLQVGEVQSSNQSFSYLSLSPRCIWIGTIVSLDNLSSYYQGHSNTYV